MQERFDGIVMLFIGVAIAAIMVANVVMPSLTNVTTTNWSASAIALWGVTSIAVIAVFVLMIFGRR